MQGRREMESSNPEGICHLSVIPPDFSFSGRDTQSWNYSALDHICCSCISRCDLLLAKESQPIVPYGLARRIVADTCDNRSFLS